MKRKVKFQEGGAVEEPARRPARESARNRQLREMMEKRGREGKRVGLAERARQRETASQAARRAAAGERASALRDVAELNQRPEVQERNRRTSAEPRRIPTPPRPSTVRPMANLPPQAIPEPPRPSTVSPVGRAAPPATSLAGRAAGFAGRAAGRLLPGAAALMPTSLEEGARFEREGLAQAREEQRMRDRAVMEQGMGETGSRMPTPRPAPAPARRPAAPAPAPRRELTMEEIRALRSGERAPRTSEERALREGLRDLPQRREMTAEELNEREYQRILAARAAEEEAALQMGGSGNIGAASARERGEQVGPTGDYNMKKGGVVKKKAGGMIKAAPKKMMKGGIVAKPKAAAPKPKAKAKPMPFKKGGMIKKGRK